MMMMMTVQTSIPVDGEVFEEYSECHDGDRSNVVAPVKGQRSWIMYLTAKIRPKVRIMVFVIIQDNPCLAELLVS